MTVDTGLPSSCARAASAEESRFRIDRPIAPSRAGRVVALDARAAEPGGRRTAGHARTTVSGPW